MTPVLEVHDLHVRRGRRDVLAHVDVQVARGEVVAVLGPNGAGKSTLLEAIGGIRPVASGQVDLDGRVATVLQTPGLARRSVRANVEAALGWWGVPRRQRRDRATAALALMRAEHLARRPADALSGGERRRVHVARGLALRPDLLLLDEPFAGLDAGTRAALCADTAEALRSSAGGVVIVVHDRAEAWALADRLVVLDGGRVVATGAPDELLVAPPTPEVARFLGYDGELHDGDGLLLTRPPHVRLDLDPDALGLSGTVEQVLRLEDGARVRVRLPHGVVSAVASGPAPRPGDAVGVRIEGGVRFPGGEAG